MSEYMELETIQEVEEDTHEEHCELKKPSGTYSAPPSQPASLLPQLQAAEKKLEEMTTLCQRKNNDIMILERKVNQLSQELEAKDRQLIDMVAMSKEFHLLCETQDASAQTDPMYDVQAALREKDNQKLYIKELETQLAIAEASIAQLKQKLERASSEVYKSRDMQDISRSSYYKETDYSRTPQTRESVEAPRPYGLKDSPESYLYIPTLSKVTFQPSSKPPSRQSMASPSCEVPARPESTPRSQNSSSNVPASSAIHVKGPSNSVGNLRGLEAQTSKASRQPVFCPSVMRKPRYMPNV